MRHAVAIGILVAICFAAYHNSLRNGFTYDDHSVLLGNHFITRVRYLPDVFRFWDQSYYEKFFERSYRPAVTLSYFADYALWKFRPLGYHLVNLGIHCAAVALLFVFLSQVLGKAAPALVGAAFYAVHPVLTEAVNAISFRDDLLAGLFLVASLVAYVSWRQGHGRRLLHGAISVPLFIIALLAKESAVVLPGLLVLYEICFAPKSRHAFKPFPLYGVFMFVALVYAYLRLSLFGDPGVRAEPYPGGTFFTNMLTMPKVFLSYLRLVVVPTNLSVEYVVEAETAVFSPQVVGPMLAIVAYVAAVAIAAKHSKHAFFGLAWFAVSLLPVANLFPIKNVQAERYLYISLMGVGFIVGAFVNRVCVLAARRRGRLLPFGASMVLSLMVGCLMVLTMFRNPAWKDDASLWPSAVKRFPRSARAQLAMGFAFMTIEKPAEAIPYFRKALELYEEPFWIARVHFNLGGAYERLNVLEEAIAEFRKAVAIAPLYARHHTALGTTLHRTDRTEEAERELTKALALSPYEDIARAYLGTIFLGRGETGKAIEQFNKVLEINPADFETRANLGLAYLRARDVDQAIRHLGMVSQEKPEDSQVLLHLATALAIKGDLSGARRYYEKASRLRPEDPAPHRQLGSIYGRMGLPTKALSELLLAIQMGSQDVTIFVDLGNAYGSLGDRAKAAEHYRQFLSQWKTDDDLRRKVEERLELMSQTSSGSFQAGHG